jgi:hypothetical protein
MLQAARPMFTIQAMTESPLGTEVRVRKLCDGLGPLFSGRQRGGNEVEQHRLRRAQ